jgi:hypothetical protein
VGVGRKANPFRDWTVFGRRFEPQSSSPVTNSNRFGHSGKEAKYPDIRHLAQLTAMKHKILSLLYLGEMIIEK